MPAHLRKYIATYLREQSRKAPERRRGRDPYANYYRDTKIASVVRELVDLGYQPTRNRASDNESACSIVARALEKMGVHLSVPAVEKIWNTYRRNSAS
jgi:hypothetical protein